MFLDFIPFEYSASDLLFFSYAFGGVLFMSRWQKCQNLKSKGIRMSKYVANFAEKFRKTKRLSGIITSVLVFI